jgi:hypothetical protein
VYNEMMTDQDLRGAAKMLHHQSVAVTPENDPVTIVDTQVGLIQRIGCDSEAQAMQNACHMLEGTISELLKRCGDNRGRFTQSTFRYEWGGGEGGGERSERMRRGSLVPRLLVPRASGGERHLTQR